MVSNCKKLYSKFTILQAKLALSKMIITVRNHSKEFSPELIVGFGTVAAMGRLPLGLEVMRHFRTYFQSKDTSDGAGSLLGGGDLELRSHREDGVQHLFKTLRHFLEKQQEFGKSFAYSVKMLTILQELAV
jgi:hypothetical protein